MREKGRQKHKIDEEDVISRQDLRWIEAEPEHELKHSPAGARGIGGYWLAQTGQPEWQPDAMQ